MDAPLLHDKPLLGIAARVLLDLHVLIVGHHKYARARAVAPMEALGVRKAEKGAKSHLTSVRSHMRSHHGGHIE
jgi:hypothetical protein